MDWMGVGLWPLLVFSGCCAMRAGLWYYVTCLKVTDALNRKLLTFTILDYVKNTENELLNYAFDVKIIYCCNFFHFNVLVDTSLLSLHYT